MKRKPASLASMQADGVGRRFAVGGLALAVALVPTACTAAPPVAPGMIGDMAKAWAADVSAFPRDLPSGIEWPESPPAVLLEDDTNYEVGTSSMMAAHYWLCAWEDVYLSEVNGGDPDLASAALITVGDFQNLSMVQQYVENPGEWYAGVVATAAAGDLAPITTDFDGGCAFYREEQNNPKESN